MRLAEAEKVARAAKRGLYVGQGTVDFCHFPDIDDIHAISGIAFDAHRWGPFYRNGRFVLGRWKGVILEVEEKQVPATETCEVLRSECGSA